MPYEYGKEISLEEQIRVSVEGCNRILYLLREHQIKATFFSTVVFAKNAGDIIKRIIEEGHELASHGYYHSKFEVAHLRKSREVLEEVSGQKILGYRMARMMPVSSMDIEEAGYLYNSSLNPVYLPGRYNNYFKQRRYFYSNRLLEIPASATPIIRIPLFWLSFHNLPPALYKLLCRVTMYSDNYLNLYFHPWEFSNIKDPKYGLPMITTKRTGIEMVKAFGGWIVWAKSQNYSFAHLKTIVDKID